MNTYLGACQNLTPDDVNPETVRASSHRLSRRLSLGSAGREGSLPQGREDRPRGRQQGRAHPLRRLLRRPLPRRVPGPHARRQPRHPVRQHPRAAEPLRHVRRRHGARRRCARKTCSAPSPARPKARCRQPRRDQGRAGLPRRARGRHHRRRRPLRLRLPRRPDARTSTSPIAPASAASPPPRSSAISAPARRRTCATSRSRKGCWADVTRRALPSPCGEGSRSEPSRGCFVNSDVITGIMPVISMRVAQRSSQRAGRHQAGHDVKSVPQGSHPVEPRHLDSSPQGGGEMR